MFDSFLIFLCLGCSAEAEGIFATILPAHSLLDFFLVSESVFDFLSFFILSLSTSDLTTEETPIFGTPEDGSPPLTINLAVLSAISGSSISVLIRSSGGFGELE